MKVSFLLVNVMGKVDESKLMVKCILANGKMIRGMDLVGGVKVLMQEQDRV